jgi:hypothetical protein
MLAVQAVVGDNSLELLIAKDLALHQTYGWQESVRKWKEVLFRHHSGTRRIAPENGIELDSSMYWA